jgi:hypothetical protein
MHYAKIKFRYEEMGKSGHEEVESKREAGNELLAIIV